MHYYGKTENQLASSSVKEVLVSHKMNPFQLPAPKCKRPSVYMHRQYVQSAVIKQKRRIPLKTSVGLLWLFLGQEACGLEKIFWEGSAILFFFFLLSKPLREV